jgi:two-component system, sporulation sensor kinase E
MDTVRIQEVLADVVRFMRHEIEDRGVRVEASLPDQLPVIRGDVAQLKQVFFNVLKNALQAMSDGGLITVECRASNDFVEIHFTDTGKGISQENLGRILEPYFTTRAGGTGLGLLIVERIVRAHGGEIGIESEEGVGTTVSVRLPRRERQARLLTAGDR